MPGHNASSSRSKSRGQVRAIDFTVSVFLFILVISQLVLLIFNSEIILFSEKEINLNENVDLLAERILGFEGTQNWGIKASTPEKFGLADAGSMGNLVLDAAKIARLSGDLALLSETTGLASVNYRTLHNLLGLNQEDFVFSIRSLFEISSTASLSDAAIHLENPNGAPVEGIPVRFYVCDLKTGLVDYQGTENTDSFGDASITITPPSGADPAFFVLAIPQKGKLWGVSYSIPSNLPPTVDVRSNPDSNILAFATEINKTYALISDIVPGTNLLRHSLSLIFANGSVTGGYGSEVAQQDVLADNSFNFTWPMPTDGLVLAISAASYPGNQYNFKVISLPALLNHNGTNTGADIYPVLEEAQGSGELVTGGATTGTYLVVCRGLVLRVVLDYWQEEEAG